MIKNSRYRSNVCTVFDVFCEVGVGVDGPLILQKYPDDFTDEPTLKSICQFSFPCPPTEDVSDAVQLFSFVLTDAQSLYTFGYCRYTPRNNTCIVMLSGFPWHGVFYKLLNHISVVMNNGTQDEVDGILTRIYHSDTPNSGEKIHFESNNGSHPLDIEIPDLNRLPTLRDDKYMLEFFNAVSQRQMMAIYASLLKERRIIFTGKKLSQLSSCIHAAATLIYPMHWQYLFIPVLPSSLKDMLHAPMPFLIGVPKQVVDTSEMRDLGDVMVVDLDDKTLQGAHDDMVLMPGDIVSYLKSHLKAAVDMGDSLSRAFVRANVFLFGGYRLGFVRNEETGVITWEKEKFVTEQKFSHQNYLNSLLGQDGVQYLERFIEERLHALNLGLPINDEFEREISTLDMKAVHPEVMKHAVNSVKENATDVLGAIKDKMTSIQIRDKLGRLTPKEIRKASSRKMKKTPKTTTGIEPLSFDNLQWTEEAYGSSEGSREPSPRPEENDASPSSSRMNGGVEVADLIDLGDDAVEVNQFADLFPATSHDPPPIPQRPPPVPPKGPAVQSLTNGFDPFAPIVGSKNPFITSEQTISPSNSGVFTNPFYNMSNTPRTDNWEKFD